MHRFTRPLAAVAETAIGLRATPIFDRARPEMSRPELRDELDDRLERLVEGEAEARAWLYDTFAPRLFRRLRARYGGQRGIDPEELLHDAFISYFQHDARVLARFVDQTPSSERSEARLEGYLWGLACGIASNRRRSLRRQGESTEFDEQGGTASVDAEGRTIERDTLQRLAGCLKRAGSRIYLYYKLRFVEGRTPEEIATATGWSRKATYKLKLSLNAAVERCARLLRIG